MNDPLKKVLHRIIESSDPKDVTTRIDDFILTGLILVNVVAVMLETVEWMSTRYRAVFAGVEGASVAIFSIEFILRVWVCTERPRFRHPVWGRLRYLGTPMALVDFLAIAPYYYVLFRSRESAAFLDDGALRLLWMVRLLKLTRYSESFRSVVRVIVARRHELTVSVTLVLALLVFAASLLYYVEHKVQPTTFSSIPAAMWWAGVTLTTVGYGDVYPVTPLGKACALIIAIAGVGVFAIPAGILASGFAEQLNRAPSLCPHCGKDPTRPETPLE